jgi:hypothetical protein
MEVPVPRCAASWSRVYVQIALAVLVGSAAFPRRAAACTCALYSASTEWPEQGATDVPIDTPIVIARMAQDGPLDDIAFELRDAAGDLVALREVARIPPAYLGCGAAELLFLRPEASLEPDAEYQVEFDTPPVPGQSQYPPRTVQFRTGKDLFEPELPIEATARYVRLQSPRCEGEVCPAMGQVRVELSSRPSTPVWLNVRSYEPRFGTYVQRLRPEHLPVRPEERPTDWAWTAGVKLVEAGSSCIEATIYGVEGVSLHDWTGCEPDGCAITSRWGAGACGGTPTSAVETLRIHDGTCANPPLLDTTAGDGIAYPDQDTEGLEASDDAGASDSDQRGEPTPRRNIGCNVTLDASAAHGSGVAALLIAWIISHRRRRMPAR